MFIAQSYLLCIINADGANWTRLGGLQENCMEVSRPQPGFFPGAIVLGPRGNNSLVMNRRGSNSSALSSMSSGEKAVMQSINAGVASLSVDDNEAPPTAPATAPATALQTLQTLRLRPSEEGSASAQPPQTKKQRNQYQRPHGRKGCILFEHH